MKRLLLLVLVVPLWAQQFPDQLVVGVPNDSLVPGSCNSNYIIYYVQPDNPPTLWGCSQTSQTYVKLGGSSSSGTVTSVAVASVPSWMTSSVANPTTTPSITLSTASGQTANQVLATPNGSSGSVGLRALVVTDLPSGTTQTVASGTAALGTGAISSATCASVITVAATGVLTTDNIQADFNADPTGVTGYSPTTSGILTIFKYPTAGNVNFKVCNNTSGSITPGAITLNWRVVR